MKCNIHGDDEKWNVKYMYEVFLDSPKIHFKTTDKCCCKKFELELNEKANTILNDL